MCQKGSTLPYSALRSPTVITYSKNFGSIRINYTYLSFITFFPRKSDLVSAVLEIWTFGETHLSGTPLFHLLENKFTSRYFCVKRLQTLDIYAVPPALDFIFTAEKCRN